MSKEYLMPRYRVQSHSAAEASAIYALLLDAGTWPDWMPVDLVEVESPATATEGELRRVTHGRQVSRERVTFLEADRRFCYEVESEHFKHYHGEVRLIPTAPRGTLIDWTASFQTRKTLMAWPMTYVLWRFMSRSVNRLARLAELAKGAEGTHS
jgi:hypothetical protein